MKTIKKICLTMLAIAAMAGAIHMNTATVNAKEQKDITVYDPDTDSDKLCEINMSDTLNVFENEHIILDYSTADEGYIRVKSKTENKRLTVAMYCPSGVRYDYNDVKPMKWLTIPLSEGNGIYKVGMIPYSVYTRVKAYDYASSASLSFDAAISNKFNPFLCSNCRVNYNKNTLYVKKADALCKGVKSETEKVRRIYKWLIKSFEYDHKKSKKIHAGKVSTGRSVYRPSLNKLYKAKKGVCIDYAIIMTAMLRSQGIPCKLECGYTMPHNDGDSGHAWVSVYVKKGGKIDKYVSLKSKKWTRLDPTYADTTNNYAKSMKYVKNNKNYVVARVY